MRARPGPDGAGAARAGETLGVVDFEHAGPDLWLIDLVKLADRPWRAREREAFLSAYGRVLAPEDEALLERLLVLHAVATVAWSRAHGDVAYEAHGRALLGHVLR